MIIDFTKDEVKYIKASIDYDVAMATAMSQAGYMYNKKEKKQYETLLSIKQKLDNKSGRKIK